MRKRTKAAAAAAMALAMLCGALPVVPGGAELLKAPLTAHAAGSVTLDRETGTLYLDGAVTKEQIWEYRAPEIRDDDEDYPAWQVKSIVANEGCVLPKDCSNLFDGGEWECIWEPDSDREYHYHRWWYGVSRIDLSKADTSNVTSMSDMFSDLQHIVSINLNGIDTSGVKYMSGMFANSEVSVDLSNFNTSNVESMYEMFANFRGQQVLNLSSFDTSKVTDMTRMFYMCDGWEEYSWMFGAEPNWYEDSSFSSYYEPIPILETVYVSDLWNTNAVTNSTEMFHNVPVLVGGNGTRYDENHIDKQYACIDGKDGNPGYFCLNGTVPLRPVQLNEETGVLTLTGEVTKPLLWVYKDNTTVKRVVTEAGCVLPEDCSHLFDGWSSLREIDLSKADSSHVTNMSSMFSYCNITSLNLSNLDTSNVTDMSYMFYTCERLTELDLSSFDTSNVLKMNSMFYSTGVKSLDLSSFDTSKVTKMEGMFEEAFNLETIYVSDLWNTDSVSRDSWLFYGNDRLKGGAFTAYADVKNHSIEYARIDNPPYEPGYLTFKPRRNIVKGVSISLDDQIGLNFYVKPNSAHVEKFILSDSFTKKEYKLEDLTPISSGKYKDCVKLSFGLNATQAGDKVTLVIEDKLFLRMDIYKSDGTLCEGKKLQYSVNDYIADSQNYASDEHLKKLVESLDNYCKAASNYFCGKDYTVEGIEDVTIDKFEPYKQPLHGAKLTLVLNSRLELRLLIPYVLGNTVQAEQGSLPNFIGMVDERYYRMTGITAAQIPLLDSYEIDTSKIKTTTFTLSPLTYGYYVMKNSDDEALKTVVRALYVYGQAAREYSLQEDAS